MNSESRATSAKELRESYQHKAGRLRKAAFSKALIQYDMSMAGVKMAYQMCICHRQNDLLRKVTIVMSAP
jgi:hypothetical protein